MNPRIYAAWQLIRTSAELIYRHRTLLVYIVANNLACLATLSLIFAPIYHHELKAIIDNHYTWLTIASPIAMLMIYFIFHHFFHIYFYTALTAAIDQIWQQDSCTVAASFRHANTLIAKLCRWTFVVCVFGVPLRVIEGWTRSWYQLKLVQKYLAGLNWGIASYLALPVFVVEGTQASKTLIRSAQLMRQHWDSEFNPNFHLGLVFIPLNIISLIPALLGFYKGSHEAIGYGIAITGVFLIFLSSISSTIYSIIKSYAYYYITDHAGQQLLPDTIAEYFKK